MAVKRFKKPKRIEKIRAVRGRLTNVALSRGRLADRWKRGFARALQLDTDAYVRSVSRAALGGGQFPTDLANAYRRKYHDTKRRWVYRIVQSGFDWASDEVLPAARQAVSGVAVTSVAKASADWHGKQTADVVVGGGETGESAEFLLQGDFPKIDAWVQTTAAAEVVTTAGRLGKIWRDAVASRDPKTGVAWTTTQISKSIRERGFAMSETRADMLARTGTMWSLNEGAQQRYKMAGVQAEEWIVSMDDVLCPFCATMHNKIVSVDQPFWNGEDTMLVEQGEKTVKLSFVSNVEHPPLHPNCRCTIVPVLR